MEADGTAAFGHISWTTTLLLAGTGAATSIPLLLFAYGARQVTLTTLGILQYIAPTMQFIIGVTIYNEPFTSQRIIGFSITWSVCMKMTLRARSVTNTPKATRMMIMAIQCDCSTRRE